ncbi:MAG: PEP-CTERM sorting domain-containing protein [Phycisphaerales bacterium]|nr:PEP-CTERM sorting domain-containing protein [Phycisphaerales bacterium]
MKRYWMTCALACVSLLGVAMPVHATVVGSLQSELSDAGQNPTTTGSFTNLPIDGSWVVLEELMTEGSFYSPIFSYTSATPVQLDVTDLFVVSDQNEVYLDGLLHGTTPLEPDWQSLFPAVGPLDGPYTSDPDLAWTLPEFSKDTYVLPSGTHILTFRNIHIPLDEENVPFSDGTVAFRLVPEPATGLLLLVGIAFGARSRRQRNTCRIDRDLKRNAQSSRLIVRGLVSAVLCGLVADIAHAGTPCGSIEADVVANALEITGTSGPDSVRVAISASDSDVVEVFTPASSTTASCSFDSNVTPFDTIRVTSGDGADLIVFDDSNGIVSDSWTIEIDTGNGDNIALGGLDVSEVPLNDALTMLDTLQQARDLIDRVLELVDVSSTGCQTVPCLVSNAAEAAKLTGTDLIIPTGEYVRDINGELIQPTAAVVHDAHDRLASYLQSFVASDVLDITTNAQEFSADVEVMVDEFELLFPIAQGLLGRAELLYTRAENMGLNAQNGDGVQVFRQTVESHVLTIEQLSELCPEDVEPVETEFDEDLQDPTGLTSFSFYCAELERRVEALEAIVDDTEASVDAIEAEGDTLEADGDTLEVDADALGDDENPTSDVSLLMADSDALVVSGDALSTSADAINADWEQWIAIQEADLESRGDNMHDRGQTEVLAAGETLKTYVDTNVEDVAEAIETEAMSILADLDALMVVAAPLLEGTSARSATGNEDRGTGGCTITTTHTISGGSGVNVLVGTPGNDLITGGNNLDLIIGGPGDDRLLGLGGNDLIFGGGGNNEIRGGDDTDILIGASGNDCIYGGNGQTISAGPLSVELGDLYFGLDGDDVIASGETEVDEVVGIDFVLAGGGDDRVRVSHGGNIDVGVFEFDFGNLVFGQGGEDDIVVLDGIDLVFGGDENDAITTGQGSLITIGPGTGTFRVALGDLIFGGTGNDTINGDDPDADRAGDDIDFIFGRDGNDVIAGFGGGLLSVGPASNPTFEIDLGNLIFGSTGDDEISTLDGIDVIFGGENDDNISTGKGARLALGSNSNGFRLDLGDLIFAGPGNDTVESDDPDGDREDDDIDVIFGAEGNDIISGFGGGLLSIGDESDPDFELRLGNVIFGGDGDDNITTLDGIDLIFAGADNDTAAAGKGDRIEIDDAFALDFGDLIFGQTGNDILHGDQADPSDESDGIDLIFCGVGNDQAYGGTGGNIELPSQNFCLLFGNLIFGGDGDDVLRGDYLNWDTNDLEGGIDLIFGRDGNDTIEGSEGSLIIIGDISTAQAIIIGFGNILFGGDGNDVIRGANEAPLCPGENQDLDNIFSSLGITDLSGAADLIFASSGDDTVEAYNGIDFVFGSGGNDMLHADHGGLVVVPISGIPTPIALGNLMFGSDGTDTITSLGRLLTIAIPPIEIDLLFGGKCDDNISAGDGFNLVFGNLADDTITAGDGVNILFGSKGKDVIEAGSGLNVVFGGRDDDDLTAGNGVNVMFGNREKDILNAGAGLNVLFGNKDDDIINSGPGLNVLFGNSGEDQVVGGSGLYLGFGGRGNDEVVGGSGLTLLFGGAGEDEVTAGAGLCLAFGSSGHDIISSGSGLSLQFGGKDDDRLKFPSGLSLLFGGKQSDILETSGGGLLLAFGGSDNDVIKGGGGLNLLFGGHHNDQFFGGGGVNIGFGGRDDDVMRGAGSADFLFGGVGTDIISGGSSVDFIFGGRGNDSLVGDNGKDFLFGGRNNDVVRSGGDGNTRDFLFGNRGDDNLYGCNDKDRLFGGRGSDNKDRENCDGLTLPAPARGEVRGRVMIDTTGDGIGDTPHVGVTVTVGSLSAVTGSDGRYRMVGLAPGSYTTAQTVPSGYIQISTPATYAISIGSMGVDLYLDRDFVNREPCFIAPDALSCIGTGCDPQNPGCQAVALQPTLRCADSGEICGGDSDCPCSECVPSWEVVECQCNPDCYFTDIPFDGEVDPSCSICFDGGQVFACELDEGVNDLYHCECPGIGACCDPATAACVETTAGECFGIWQGAGTTCDQELCLVEPDPIGACCCYGPNGGSCSEIEEAFCAYGEWLGEGTTCGEDTCNQCAPSWDHFRFRGIVTEVTGQLPGGVTISVGADWTFEYWMRTDWPDQNPNPDQGDYSPIVSYTSTVQGATGAIGASSCVEQATATNVNMPMAYNAFMFALPSFIEINLEDHTGTAWLTAGLNPLDALPRCDQIVLNRFSTRTFTIHSDGPPSWMINGTITAIECDGCGDQPLPIAPADFNADHFVDSEDFSMFQACTVGPMKLHDGTATCEHADIDWDEDVDLVDFSIFQRCYRGDQPADPGCGQ